MLTFAEKNWYVDNDFFMSQNMISSILYYVYTELEILFSEGSE